jgi:hypothetical protein
MVFPVLYPEEDVRGHRLSRKQRQYIKGGELILVGKITSAEFAIMGI